jgi:CRISPR-associated protein Csm2
MPDQRINRILTEDENGRELVTFAEEKAQTLVRNNLRNSQIRNIFSEVRRIDALRTQDPEAALRRLQMLKPKLAYQAERQRQVSELKNVLTEAIDQITQIEGKNEQDKAFDRFMDLFEAILAYHKAKGGRN